MLTDSMRFAAWRTGAVAAFTAAVSVVVLGQALVPTTESTMPKSNGGGSTIPVVALGDLPQYTDIVVRGTVIDILPVELNTMTGAVDNELDSLVGVAPLTPVVIRVDETVGQRSALRPDVKPGDALEVVVDGGHFAFVIPFAQARALGLVAPDQHEEPGQPIEAFIQQTPDVSLQTGDDVLIFLASTPLVLVGEGVQPTEVWRPVFASQGVFLTGREGVTQANDQRFEQPATATLGKALGEARRVTSLAGAATEMWRASSR